MNDKFAMGHIYDVIDDKGNVQVNLNMPSFKRGIIDYMVTDEKDLKLAFSYPTGIARPEAGHGLLNYYLIT